MRVQRWEQIDVPGRVATKQSKSRCVIEQAELCFCLTRVAPRLSNLIVIGSGKPSKQVKVK